MDAKDWALLALVKRQRGVVSYEQARKAGFNQSAMRWRLESGEWVPMCPGVVRMYWAEDAWTVRCRAASLWVGAELIGLSHLSAAQVLGFDVDADETVDVTVNRDTKRTRHPWCRVHSSAARQSIEVDGLRVTTPARTMVDLAAVLDAVELERVLHVVMRVGAVSTSALREELSGSQQGHSGVATLRRLFRLVRG